MTDTLKPCASEFWEKVDKGTDAECWNWLGAKNNRGYGNYRSGLAHRVSYEATKGAIPPDMTVDHICRNTSCVNPSHLRILSQYENNMAGDSPCAANARKLTCANGHELSEGNVKIVVRPDGTRRKCRVCHRMYEAKRKSKNV